MNSRDCIPFLIADCSGIIDLKLKEAETERTCIEYPSANKNSSLLVNRKRHCSTWPKKRSEMCDIDPYHWICNS